MTNLYYVPPPDNCFEDMKRACLDVWGKYKNSPGDYYKEKTARIPDMENVGDNFMYLFAMFDFPNQRQVISLLESETIEEVRKRLIAGGNPLALVGTITGI